MLDVRFPAAGSMSAEALLRQVRGAVLDGDGGLEVGDERVRAFLSSFGKRLLRPVLARRHPELGSLGFFLRPSELARTVASLGREHVRVPRGLIFHIPPANVDTVFVYSWALSALMGNRNVVRLSPRSGPVAEVIVETLHEALAEADPAVAATQRIVSYDRSDAVTAALSAACDLRVVWGGDRTVREIRLQPLPPHARDLVFPDRSSFAVVRAAAWLCAPRAARVTVAEGFVNDTYWFDQAACSSPRTVFWVGAEGDCEAARTDFIDHLSRVLTVRGWGVDAAMAVEKRVSTYGLAADGLAESVEFRGNALASVRLAAATAAPRRWLGAGTFAHARLAALGELVGLVERRDQTMTHFGFGGDELEELARGLGGRGVDRMVPVGSALSFHRVWDGVDLPAEFTRLVTVIR
ncbi:Acyl-CoA reductase (LuxC) [Nonomuraea solani]|uniref:long-chain-fatty-acyl-CoA reductase n=2 Tax=Nonomuraea solani TaxID=1144553 RepID=A0A1H6ESC9_9ACTN|nr:Acyl-CoA reductase (LuxC) [Nonomuraea solani]